MKNYLVIGGSSGVGKALCEQLVQSGHRVYATYNENRVQSDNELISYYPLNVLEENLELSFLPDTLDGFVYCPGSINLKPFARIKPNDFTDDFNLQVGGAIKVIKQVLSNLKNSEQASAVLFSTVAVQYGFNFHSQVSTSKGAIDGLTRALAAEFAPKIRVNCIAPSLTDTPLAKKLLSSLEKKEANAQRHPLKQIGTANDIAEMASFLLTDRSKWISGQVMHVDGGMSTIKT